MMDENQTNASAWALLDEALFTSKHVKAKDIEVGSTEWENVYPTSLEEADRMDELMDKAEQEAGSQRGEDFNKRLHELREITAWSRKRHKTWKWSLIAGAVLSALILLYFDTENKGSVRKAEADVALVRDWVACDTTIAYEEVSEQRSAYDGSRFNSAKTFKIYLLGKSKADIISGEKMVAEYAAKADTATDEQRRNDYLKQVESGKADAAKCRAAFEKVSRMGFAEIQAEAMQEAEQSLKVSESAKGTTTAWMAYLIVLISLYIISGYPRGYLITRHRKQHGLMDKLQRFGYRAATLFFGSGILMNLLPDDIVRFRHSDASTRTGRETRSGNILVLVLKLGLVVVGILLFCLTAVLIMTIQTATGLKRHFNWKPLFGKKKPTTT